MTLQKLTYETRAAESMRTFTSDVLLKVANETLPCLAKITYHPDPEFISFTNTKTGDDLRITIQVMLVFFLGSHAQIMHRNP